MRFTRTGVAVAAAVAAGAFGVGALGTGIANGAPRPAAKSAKLPGTFQMYANVDQLGDLGSNVGAKSVKVEVEGLFYAVTFSRPIGACAAQAQPGFAGGNLVAGPWSSEVFDIGPNTLAVQIFKSVTGQYTYSAFMLTVTCPS